MNVVLRHLRRLSYLQDQDQLSDGQLLEQFLSRREEAAFEALVRRHGAMVLGVCRRVLHNEADAEDAFQATFLVLVRKAGSVQPRDLVGHWLYGVAYRTAIRAKALEAKRRMKERAVPPSAANHPGSWQDVLPLLDQELDGLPEKYRVPVVLCDLEGKSRKEVARILGCREGTLSSRLARARVLLAWRLARGGVGLSAGMLASLVAAHGSSASVPVSLLSATVKAALVAASAPTLAAACVSVKVATLTQGVLKTMLFAKLKTVTLLCCGVTALGMGTGGLLYQAQAGAFDSGKPGAVAASVGLGASQTRKLDGEDEQATQSTLRRAEKEARLALEREQKLRDQLEKARQEAEEYRKAAQAQRDAAEAERKRADAVLYQATLQLKQAQVAELQARKDAETARYVGVLQQAQATRQAVDKTKTQPGAKPDGTTSVSDIDAHKAKLLTIRDTIANEFRTRAEDLARQIEKLKIEFTKQEADLQAQRAELMQQYGQRMQSLEDELKRLEQGRQSRMEREREKAAPSAKQKASPSTQSQATGDKLERILERLERLEQRLDRMGAGPGPDQTLVL
jgi:RNA polymerase sigma factor (sigma-70 family)